MKLLILSDSLLYKKNGSYFSKDTFLKFLKYFKRYFGYITICAPVSHDILKTESLYRISLFDNGTIDIRETFPYITVIKFYKKLHMILFYNLPLFIKKIKTADIVFLRVPAMNAFLVAFLAWIYKKSVFCYFVGDERSVILNGGKHKCLRLRIALIISKFHSFLYKKIIRFSKASFFLSTELKNKYEKYNTNSFFIFTSLIDRSDIYIRKKKLYKHHNTIKLLYVGRLSHEKGILYLLQSMQSLIQIKPGIKVLLCGDGPEKETLQNAVKKLRLHKYIDFLGFLPWGKQLNELYRKSDIFTLPSLAEGIPKVLLEAMSKGLPIITTKVGGIPDIIKNMENGILVPPKDPQAITQAVKLIIENDALRNKIIENGYTNAKEHTASRQVEKIAEIIHKYA